MKQNRNTSIKLKLPLYLLAFVIVMIALLWLLEVRMLDPIYHNIKVRSVTQTGNLIASEIENKRLSDYIDQVAISSDTCVVMMDLNGNVVMKSVGGRQCDREITEASNLNERILGALNSSNQTFVEEVEKQTLVINGGLSNPDMQLKAAKEIQYTRIVTMDNQSYLLFLSTSLTPLTATTQTLQMILIIVTIGMSIVAILFGLYISLKVSKPIAQINQEAKLLGQKDDVKFDVSGYQEVIELSDTLNQAHADLQQVQKLRNELIANISHDLRTPLTMITGYAEMMRDLPNENTPENLKVIIDETHYLSNLVNDVLDLSKLQAGTQKLNLSVFSITEILKQTMNRFKTIQDVQIILNENQDIQVEADPVKIQQVIYNFLVNAINYCGEDKKVIVNQIVQSNLVRIEVVDHGKGISSEELEKVWECYYRTNNDHVRGISGSGIGLYIVKQILDLHQAHYGVESVVDQGSVFYFELKIRA